MTDERLTAPEVAEWLGVKPDTWWAWVTRHRAPEPDGREELSGKPWWWRSTIAAWNAQRPGRVGRPRTRSVSP